MSKSKFKTKYNRKPSDGEKPEGESLTVQGEAMTIQELYRKANAGMVIDGLRKEIPYLDADINEINHLYRNSYDLTDLQELASKVSSMRSKLYAEIERQEKEKNKAQEPVEPEEPKEPEEE